MGLYLQWPTFNFEFFFFFGGGVDTCNSCTRTGPRFCGAQDQLICYCCPFCFSRQFLIWQSIFKNKIFNIHNRQLLGHRNTEKFHSKELVSSLFHKAYTQQ